MTLRGPRPDHEPPQPAGPSLQNPFGVHLEQIGVLHEGGVWIYRRAWRDGRLMGRVVDRTNYAKDGTTGPKAFEFEAQIWDGRSYDEEGVIYRSFWDALEFIA